MKVLKTEVKSRNKQYFYSRLYFDKEEELKEFDNLLDSIREMWGVNRKDMKHSEIIRKALKKYIEIEKIIKD